MVGRKVQRLEIVVVAFHLRAFGDRVAHVDEDGDDLVQGAQHRMAHAQPRVMPGRVMSMRSEASLASAPAPAIFCRVSSIACSASLFQGVDALSNIALVAAGAALSQRSLICVRMPFLRAIQRSRTPSIRLRSEPSAFLLQRFQQLPRSFVQCLGRVIFEFWDGVHGKHLTSIPSRMSF